MTYRALYCMTFKVASGLRVADYTVRTALAAAFKELLLRLTQLHATFYNGLCYCCICAKSCVVS
jgi:hypothetical protein